MENCVYIISKQPIIFCLINRASVFFYKHSFGFREQGFTQKCVLWEFFKTTSLFFFHESGDVDLVAFFPVISWEKITILIQKLQNNCFNYKTHWVYWECFASKQDFAAISRSLMHEETVSSNTVTLQKSAELDKTPSLNSRNSSLITILYQ